MINISVKSNVAEFARTWGAAAQKQVTFATALALNDVAVMAKNDLRDTMQSVFDRPTPFTLNSLRVRRASKATLVAAVYFRDDMKGSAASPSHYLFPQVEGGARPMKRMERALQHYGYLPAGWFAVPGSAAKLDVYGNMSRGQVMQILSALGASEMVAGHTSNRTMNSKRRRRNLPNLFAIVPGRGSHLAPGVWQRFGFARGSAVKPILIFVSSAQYKRRFPYIGVVQRAVDRNFERAFKSSMQRALMP